MENIPLLKRAKLTEVVHLRVERELSDMLRVMKAQYGLDGGELVRAYLRVELPKIKKRLEKTA